MLRIKLSKLKQICTTALIPRILKETKVIKKEKDKCSIDYLSKATHKKYKCTESGSKDDNYDKRKAIIKQCFSEKPQIYEKDTTTLLFSKDKVTLSNNKDKSISKQSTATKKDETENKFGEQAQNAKVQNIAAKVEEVKLAYDVIQTDNKLHFNTDTVRNSSGLLENSKVEINTETARSEIEQENQDINQTSKTTLKDIGETEVLELLQHTNVQTSAGNTGGDKKRPLRINIEKARDGLDIPKISEVFQESESHVAASKFEAERVPQPTVHIEKTPLADIDAEGKDSKYTNSVLELPQNIEDRTVKPELEKFTLVDNNKISPVSIKLDNYNVSSKVSELEQVSNVQATTAKIEEEKLAQKIDNIHETPHVEATPAIVEGFNVSPKILGHDSTSNLFINESKTDDVTYQPDKVNFDELTKKCPRKSDGGIDQILHKEMRNFSLTDSLKLDMPRDGSSQKYSSQILKDKTKENNNIVFDISETHHEHILRNEIKTGNEIKLENFYPFYLDTVPIVTINTRDYKDEWNRKYSTDGVKNLLLDIPAVLDPYDMQAIPFYQYVSKEKIILKEIQLGETPIQKSLPNEAAQDTEFNAPMNEEVILNREEIENNREPELNELEEGKAIDRKIATVNAVEPLQEVNTRSVESTEKPNLSESDISKLLEYKNVLTAKQDAIGTNMSPNIVPSRIPVMDGRTQHAEPSLTDVQSFSLKNNTNDTVLTSETITPTGGLNNPMGYARSGHYPPYHSSYQTEQDKQSDENQTDTAISAHQNADEYFPTSHFNSFMGAGIQQVEYDVTDSSVTYTGVFDTKTMYCNTTEELSNDNLMSQSISYYSTFPQLSDFLNETSNSPDGFTPNLVEREHIKHVLKPLNKKKDYIRSENNQPEHKQEESKSEAVIQASVNNEMDLSDETLPLSVLLRRVRERSRLEILRSIKVEPEIGKKPCIPPLDKSKPKSGLSPKPCQPKPKEENKCPSPCKPQKKDPCAKFTPFFLHTIVGSNIDILIPPLSKYDQTYTYMSLAKEIANKKIKHLTNILSFLHIKNSEDEIAVECARDFKPWVPIPSWPIPKVEKKRPFVCPREGCKLPVNPVRSNTDKPCLGMPKKISPSKTVNFANLSNQDIY